MRKKAEELDGVEEGVVEGSGLGGERKGGRTTPKDSCDPSRPGGVLMLPEGVQVMGRRQWRRQVVPECACARCEGLETVIKSCIRKLDCKRMTLSVVTTTPQRSLDKR